MQNSNVVRQMREICQISEQMREISQQEQICEMWDPQKSILPTHDFRIFKSHFAIFMGNHGTGGSAPLVRESNLCVSVV